MNASSTSTSNATLKVLSVNPGRSTLGHMNALEAFGASVRMPRARMLADDATAPSLAGILFPVKKMNLSGSVVLLAVRIGFASLLMAGGFSIIGSPMTVWGVLELVLAAFVAVGFMTRALMVVPAIVFGMLAGHAPGTAEAVLPALCSLVSVLLMIFGSGWLSVDALIRVAIRRHNARNRGKMPHRNLTPDYPLADLRTVY